MFDDDETYMCDPYDTNGKKLAGVKYTDNCLRNTTGLPYCNGCTALVKRTRTYAYSRVFKGVE